MPTVHLPPPNLDPGWLSQEIAQIYFYEKMEKKPTTVKNEAGKVTRAVHEQGGQKLEVSKIE